VWQVFSNLDSSLFKIKSGVAVSPSAGCEWDGSRVREPSKRIVNGMRGNVRCRNYLWELMTAV
jgi:hypothetical protein